MSGVLMVQGTDVFIVGGGPAGLAAALATRKKGFTVTVADGGKPPVDKPCGEGLLPDALAALHDLHVRLRPGEGYPFSRVRFLDKNHKVDARFPLADGIGIPRVVLHQRMVEQADAAGITLLWNTPVTGLAEDGIIAGGHRIEARWIVGADGTRSRVRRWSGLEAPLQYDFRFAYRRHYAVEPWSDAVEIYWGETAQAYVTPIGKREVCAVVISRHPYTHLETLFEDYPELRDRLESEEQTVRERGTITPMHRLKRIWRANVALVGDASGGVDAITGDGLCLSFRQAVALANALEVGDLRLYQEEHRRLARRPALMGQFMLLLDRRPGLRRRLMRALARNPEIFARLLAVHVGEASSAQTVRTGARLGWELMWA